MTDFTNLAALVAQGQSLLDLVKGGVITQLEADNAAKLGEVDKALALKIAQANTAIANAIAPVNEKIPKKSLTLNNVLAVTSGTVPDGWSVPAAATITTHAMVSYSPLLRDAVVTALLTQMESEVKEQFVDFSMRADAYYFRDFNVIKIDWDFGVDFDGIENLLTIPSVDIGPLGSRFRATSDMTAQSMIKVLSGAVFNDGFSMGSVLGKWRYCSNQYIDSGFGYYFNILMQATSQTGSLLIALPSVVTGLVSQPKDIYF
jgi:hypothetical protein